MANRVPGRLDIRPMTDGLRCDRGAQPAVVRRRLVMGALGLQHFQVGALGGRFQALARPAGGGAEREAERQAGLELVVDRDQVVDVLDHGLAIALSNERIRYLTADSQLRSRQKSMGVLSPFM
jgi:hypothetical protein